MYLYMQITKVKIILTSSYIQTIWVLEKEREELKYNILIYVYKYLKRKHLTDIYWSKIGLNTIFLYHIILYCLKHDRQYQKNNVGLWQWWYLI